MAQVRTQVLEYPRTVRMLGKYLRTASTVLSRSCPQDTEPAHVILYFIVLLLAFICPRSQTSPLPTCCRPSSLPCTSFLGNAAPSIHPGCFETRKISPPRHEGHPQPGPIAVGGGQATCPEAPPDDSSPSARDPPERPNKHRCVFSLSLFSVIDPVGLLTLLPSERRTVARSGKIRPGQVRSRSGQVQLVDTGHRLLPWELCIPIQEGPIHHLAMSNSSPVSSVTSYLEQSFTLLSSAAAYMRLPAIASTVTPPLPDSLLRLLSGMSANMLTLGRCCRSHLATVFQAKVRLSNYLPIRPMIHLCRN